jgi:SAM-dependent methyltransferase
VELVDVGGGAAHQSLPLARDGYRVTVVDPSAAMLDRAAQRLSAEAPDVAARVTLVQSSAEDASAVLDGRTFAGVLSHAVIMYVDDPDPFVASLAGLAAPGAVVSLVAKNAKSLAAGPARLGDWVGALAAFDERRSINGLGVDTRADTVEELSVMFESHGVDPVTWYGVRLFTDSVQDADEEPGPDLLAVELEGSRRDPYRQMSRLFHLVGVRR